MLTYRERVCVCMWLSHRRCFMCMGIREYNPLPIFFHARSFVCLLYLSLRSHRSGAIFTFCVFLSHSLSPTVRMRAYGILKFISFHWNGCHHKWIDFCRFVERIKNRFYAGFIMHWLYRLLRTIQCTSTRFSSLSALLRMAFCLILMLSLFGFCRSHMRAMYVRVYFCVICIYLFTFTWPFYPCFIFWLPLILLLILCGQLNDLWSFLFRNFPYQTNGTFSRPVNNSPSKLNNNDESCAIETI